MMTPDEVEQNQAAARTTDSPSDQIIGQRSLKNLSPYIITEALLSTASLELASQRLNQHYFKSRVIKSHTSLSKYLSMRGFSYDDMKLFRFFGGAVPDQAKVVLLAYQRSGFDVSRLSFDCLKVKYVGKTITVEKRYQILYSAYTVLFQRLYKLYYENKNNGVYKNNLFQYMRYMSAIRLTKTPEQAAMILTAPQDNINAFVHTYSMPLSDGILDIQADANELRHFVESLQLSDSCRDAVDNASQEWLPSGKKPSAARSKVVTQSQENTERKYLARRKNRSFSLSLDDSACHDHCTKRTRRFREKDKSTSLLAKKTMLQESHDVVEVAACFVDSRLGSAASSTLSLLSIFGDNTSDNKTIHGKSVEEYPAEQANSAFDKYLNNLSLNDQDDIGLDLFGFDPGVSSDYRP